MATTKPNDSAFSVIANDFYEGGLTKREYFAAIALQGYLAAFAGDARVEMPTPERAALEATKYADALIEELNAERP